MADFKFMDGIERLKYIKKINENTWAVQSDPESMCEAFWVTIVPRGLVMTGDYGGVIVQPYIFTAKQMIHWMAGATSIHYFTEKVHHGNRFHEYKEYTEESGLNALSAILVSLDGNMSRTRARGLITKKTDSLIGLSKDAKKALDILEFNRYDDIFCYQATIRDLEDHFKNGDFWEHNEKDYTHQILWQQHCLIWWARKLIESGEADML